MVFFFFFSWFLLCFVFDSVLCTWKAGKCTLSINHLARIHKTSHVNFRINQKMRELVCSQQCPPSIDVSSIFIEFEQQEEKKPWTLAYILVLQTMSSPLNCFFWFGPIGVPSKMMPCTLNHNLICLGLGPLSKGLGTNLKFLTNRNAQFHWTLLLGPLSKVALRLISVINYLCLVHYKKMYYDIMWHIYLNYLKFPSPI